VTKLVRNLCMIAVIPLVGMMYAAEGTLPATGRIRWLSMVPWFIVGFAGMSALRTVGDLGDRPFAVLDPATWAAMVAFIRSAAEHFLLVAMAAIGLTTMFAGLRQIGLRPFLLGLFAAALVGAVSLTLIALFAARLLTAVGL
ncbi:MAG: putative sulfate exporter family transporter, partial [Woeseia sp.]